MPSKRPQPVSIAPREIIARREAIAMNQAALAAALGIEPRTLRRYETGEQAAPALFVFALCWLEHRHAKAGRKS